MSEPAQNGNREVQMYIKNVSGTYVSGKAGDFNMSLNPGEVMFLTEEAGSDAVVRRLLARRIVEEVGEDEGAAYIADKDAAVAAERENAKMLVHASRKLSGNSILMVRCAHCERGGRSCGCTVKVALADYDPNRPYFCARHSGDDPDSYERVNGRWEPMMKVV